MRGIFCLKKACNIRHDFVFLEQSGTCDMFWYLEIGGQYHGKDLEYI